MADSPFIIQVTAQDFQAQVLEASHRVPVLVDFWADWCAPCKMLMPVLAKLVEEYKGKFLLAKVNTDEERQLAAQVGIRSLPTVMVFRDGDVVDEFLGALPEAEIRAFIERNLPHASDQLLQQADALLLRGDTDRAGQLIEQALQSDPDNPKVKLSLARQKATIGELAEAETILQALPQEERNKPEVSSMLAQLSFDRIRQNAPPAEQLEQDPENAEALYQLAACKVMDGDYEPALQLLLRVMQKDREYLDDGARKALVQIFEILGNSGDLVKRYRNQMFNLLH